MLDKRVSAEYNKKGYSWKKAAALFVAASAVFLYYLFAGCPFRFFLGVCCPTCGMTRAWLSVARLDFSCAFYFHPLFPLPVLVAAAYALDRFVFGRKIPRRVATVSLALCGVAAAAVYLFRLSDAAFADVVYIDFQRSFIYKEFIK